MAQPSTSSCDITSAVTGNRSIYSDYEVLSDHHYQLQLNYMVSRIRAALKARDVRRTMDLEEAILQYEAAWEVAFSVEVTCCLLHLGIGKTMHREMVVPKLLECLVAAEEEVNYETDDNDPTRILLGYEKAWWDEEVPVPVPILEVRKLTDKLDFQNCPEEPNEQDSMDEKNVSLQEIENTLRVVSVIRDLTGQKIAQTTRDMEIVMAEMEEYKKRLGSL